ncbi:dihydrofolate reductase [Roseateles oligotrophus]|uniref:Dihydrofolate reductase n=1 Tax=Roseateles oligotrophus TaxID=1769250 RepID=A0ABT2YFW5_9BURK|nr:dihydrofolate reductase [Roseateles oligotrophus]MCV2368924.1 dihydrofolate reductase [Roseateles oligotrophus]
MSRPKISLIAGVAKGGAIGRANQLLWRLPEDLARFKALTLGHAVIMGRKTWDSLPAKFRPLPGRRNLVLTRNPDAQVDGAEQFGNLDAALAACEGQERVFVIGGAEIYALALPLADRLELTEVEQDYPDADSFFPAWDSASFKTLSRETGISQDGLRYDFVSYQHI